MNKIGDILRKARLEEGFSFDDLIDKTDIPPHYLLAMELDQLQMLPDGKVNDYLEAYAKAVNLDPISLIHGYRNQQLIDLSGLDGYTGDQEEAKEEFSQDDFQENLTLEQTPITFPFEDVEDDTNDILMEEEDLFFKTEDLTDDNDLEALEEVPQESEPLSSRASRYDLEDETKRSFPWVFFLLGMLALGIVFYLAYMIYSQNQADSNQNQEAATSQTETTSSQTTSTTSSQVSLETDFDQAGNTITVTDAPDQVDIVFTLADEGESWVSATGTTIGEAGATLSSVETSFTATLAEGASGSTITLALPSLVSLSIAGQEVDLTSFAQSGLINLNLVIN